MKKFLLSFAAIAAFSTASFAQLSIGVKGGVNASYITESEDFFEEALEDLDTPDGFFDKESRGKLGSQFQLFGEYALSESFALGLGVQYETSGERLVYEGSLEDYKIEAEYTLTNSFVKIPVYGKYQVEAGIFKPYVAVGPYVGFWTNTEGEMAFSDNEGNSEKDGYEGFDELEEGDYQEANKVDFGATLGLGTTIAAGPGSILVGVNYDLGFVDLVDEKDDNIKNYSSKNQSLQFNVGYVISLGGSSAE